MSKFNKKEIMTHAHNTVKYAAKHGRTTTFSNALKYAWKCAKEKLETVDVRVVSFAQTEKAISLMVVEQGVNTNPYTQTIWVPKSICGQKEDGVWAVPVSFLRKKRNERKCAEVWSFTTASQSRFVI